MKIAALLLSEDGSRYAFETLEQVCRRLFDVVVPRCEIDTCVRFDPASDAARAMMCGNAWKSGKPRDYNKTLSLCRSIATHLMRDDGFVLFHLDGDARWSERSDNLEKYERIVVSKVRDYVRGQLHKDIGPDHADPLAHTMDKLVRLAPHYSIESWLFANVALLRERCRMDDTVAARLDAWASDLGELDRATKPKSLAPVDTAHYRELAAKLPTAKLMALQSSFLDAVVRTGNCGALVVRLRQSWPAYVRQSS